MQFNAGYSYTRNAAFTCNGHTHTSQGLGICRDLSGSLHTTVAIRPRPRGREQVGSSFGTTQDLILLAQGMRECWERLATHSSTLSRGYMHAVLLCSPGIAAKICAIAAKRGLLLGKPLLVHAQIANGSVRGGRGRTLACKLLLLHVAIASLEVIRSAR